jgi:hypothetical protein
MLSLLLLVVLGTCGIAAAEDKDLQIGTVTLTAYDSEGDGLDDAVDVNVTVANTNESRSWVFVMKATLNLRSAQIDIQTQSDRLDPNSSMALDLDLGTDDTSSYDTYTVVLVLYAETLGGDVMDEDSSTVALYPVGSYALDLMSNATTVTVVENTTTSFTITIESRSNNPTGVNITLDSPGGWQYELDVDYVEVDPGESVDVALRVTVPHNAAPGLRETIRVEAVSSRNSMAFTSVSLTINVPLQEFNVVLDLTGHQMFLASGDTARIVGFVRNHGNNQDDVTLMGDAPLGWEVAFVPATILLDRGTSASFEVAVTAPVDLSGSGSLIINITVRSQGLVQEDHEMLTVVYNTAEITITPENVTISPETPAAGDEVTIQATVANSGAVTTSDVVVALVSDGSEVDRTTISTIVVGGVGIATLSWTPGPGSHLVQVVVDPDDTIPEVDDTNNQVEIAVVISSPDLDVVPGGIVMDPTYPTEGSDVLITIEIRNIRPLSTGPFAVALSIDDVRVHTFDVQLGLMGEANETLEFVWTAQSGRHTFLVDLDPDGDVAEDDRSNNMATRTFSVNTMPTAVLTVNRDKARVGENFALDASDSEDSDGRVRQYFFDYGDGTDSGWIFMTYVNHTYTEKGDYEIRLYVRDEGGAQNEEPAIVIVTVTGGGSKQDPSPGPGVVLVGLALVAMAVMTLRARRRGGR